VNYEYNELKQVKQVNWNNVKQVEYSYLTNGKVNQISYANGMKHQYSYTMGRLSQLLQQDEAGVSQRAFTYTHDVNGNITRREEWESGAAASDMNQFTYDNMNRISTSSQFNESYTYDSRSNRKTLNTTSDAVLNLGTESYVYDALNRLTKVTKNGKVIEYKYDGDDLLIERKENNVTTRYYYDGRMLVAEGTVQSNGTVTEKASYLQMNGPAMMENGTGSKSYYMKNGHGDVVEMRSATGEVQNSYKYDIWGKTLQATETVSNPFRYSGEMWDSSAELQYLRARWYDPSLGRFMSEDTYKGDITNPLTLNLYAYVHHNPLIYADPTGNAPKPIGAILTHPKVIAYCAKVGVSTCWKEAEAGVIEASMAVANFMVIDDINTLLDPDASTFDKTLAAAGFIPVGKLIKGGKLVIKMTNGQGRNIERAVEVTDSNWKLASKIPCNCFTAGTKVLTDEGEKNIEDIEVGDMVLSKNEETGEQAYKEVTHLYRNDKEITYELSVGDQVIETTDNHPFWVEDKGWVLAADLQAGDKLQQSNGNTLTIENIEIVKHDEPVKVYNFTVADFHTYFVSDLGIWVHNTGCDILSPFDLVGRQTRDEMSKNQIKKLTKDMQQNGWNGPPIKVYVVDGKTIIVDGHHRAAAARQAGLKDVPVEYITEAELKNAWKVTPDELLKQTYEAGGR